MEKLTLMKYNSSWRLYKNLNKNSLKLSEEYKSDTLAINGIYFNEINTLITVFSNEAKNYLLIDNKQILLSKDISIQYYCGERQEKSWIKIFELEKLIFELDYINPIQEPYIDFVSGFEDWEVVNFAYHLAGYINKVRENPEVILFSGE
jgi:hypothetical protein